MHAQTLWLVLSTFTPSSSAKVLSALMYGIARKRDATTNDLASTTGETGADGTRIHIVNDLITYRTVRC